MNDDTDCIRALLNAGAKIDGRNDDGKSALDHAVGEGKALILSTLEEERRRHACQGLIHNGMPISIDAGAVTAGKAAERGITCERSYYNVL